MGTKVNEESKPAATGEVKQAQAVQVAEEQAEKPKQIEEAPQPQVTVSATKPEVKEEETVSSFAVREKVSEKKLDRIVEIRPAKLAPEIGGLLPGARRMFVPDRTRDGDYITGHTQEELESYKKIKATSSEFWKKYNLLLTDKKKVLFIDRSERDMLDYKFALSQPGIATSKAEVNSDTMFYIKDEEREAREENKRFEHEKNAYNYLAAMSPEDMRRFLTLFGEETKGASNEVVFKMLRDKAKEEPQVFCMRFEDTSKEVKMQINEMVEWGVMKKSSSGYFFGDIVLGIDLPSTIAYMSSPKNQEMKLNLLAKLEELKRR